MSLPLSRPIPSLSIYLLYTWMVIDPSNPLMILYCRLRRPLTLPASPPTPIPI